MQIREEHKKSNPYCIREVPRQMIKEDYKEDGRVQFPKALVHEACPREETVEIHLIACPQLHIGNRHCLLSTGDNDSLCL